MKTTAEIISVKLTCPACDATYYYDGDFDLEIYPLQNMVTFGNNWTCVFCGVDFTPRIHLNEEPKNERDN